jgi:hypothetical protein
VLAAVAALLLAAGTASANAEERATTSASHSAKQRAGSLLDDWRRTLIATLGYAKQRGDAAQKGDRRAYDRADARLRPLLARAEKFAAQGRIVMSRFSSSAADMVVGADGIRSRVRSVIIGESEPQFTGMVGCADPHRASAPDS